MLFQAIEMDVKVIIDEFAKNKDTSYSKFCEIWKKYSLPLVFWYIFEKFLNVIIVIEHN